MQAMPIRIFLGGDVRFLFHESRKRCPGRRRSQQPLYGGPAAVHEGAGTYH